MIAPVFVDTNVFVYARDAGEPVKQPRALAWLDHLWRMQMGRTGMQVLSEYYVSVTRKLAPGLPPEEAWDDVLALMAWKPQPVDREALLLGREIEQRYRLAWWDSLIVAAAQLQGCATLLTEDLQDGAVLGGVTVASPFTTRIEDITTPGPGVLPAARGRPARRGSGKRPGATE